MWWKKKMKNSSWIQSRKLALGLKVVTGGSLDQSYLKNLKGGYVNNISQDEILKQDTNGSPLTFYENLRCAQEHVGLLTHSIKQAESKLMELEAFLKSTNQKLKSIQDLTFTTRMNAEEALIHIWNAVEIYDSISE